MIRAMADMSPVPDTLFKLYMERALEELHRAGDPAVLYPWPDAVDESHADLKETIARISAQNAQTSALLTATLFTALAAEAFINGELATGLRGQDRDAADRMSPVDKYVLGTQLILNERLFDRDTPPITNIRALFALRNKLVHPKPGFAPKSTVLQDHEFAAQFAATNVADNILFVASAAQVVSSRTRTMTDPFAWLIWKGRDTIMGFAEEIATVPDRNYEAQPSLLKRVLEYEF